METESELVEYEIELKSQKEKNNLLNLVKKKAEIEYEIASQNVDREKLHEIIRRPEILRSKRNHKPMCATHLDEEIMRLSFSQMYFVHSYTQFLSDQPPLEHLLNTKMRLDREIAEITAPKPSEHQVNTGSVTETPTIDIPQHEHQADSIEKQNQHAERDDRNRLFDEDEIEAFLDEFDISSDLPSDRPFDDLDNYSTVFAETSTEMMSDTAMNVQNNNDFVETTDRPNHGVLLEHKDDQIKYDRTYDFREKYKQKTKENRLFTGSEVDWVQIYRMFDPDHHKPIDDETSVKLCIICDGKYKPSRFNYEDHLRAQHPLVHSMISINQYDESLKHVGEPNAKAYRFDWANDSNDITANYNHILYEFPCHCNECKYTDNNGGFRKSKKKRKVSAN